MSRPWLIVIGIATFLLIVFSLLVGGSIAAYLLFRKPTATVVMTDDLPSHTTPQNPRFNDTPDATPPQPERQFGNDLPTHADNAPTAGGDPPMGGNTPRFAQAPDNFSSTPAPDRNFVPNAPAPSPSSPATPSPRNASGNAPVPPDYTLVNSTQAGIAFASEKPQATSPKDAIEDCLDDLDPPYFDKEYQYEYFEDQKDHNSAVATISAEFKGHQVKGYIMAHMAKKGATVVVVFADVNATQQQWAQLTGMPAQQAAAQGNAPPRNAQASQQPMRGGQPAAPAAMSTDDLKRATAAVQMRQYKFPDGTGSVGLPQGWTTNAQSCHQAFEVDGPNGEKIQFGLGLEVNTPDSTAVQLARQYGTGGIPMVVAPYSDPATALQSLTPQLSAINQAHGQPTSVLDHVTTLQKLQPIAPNSLNAILSYGATVTTNGRPVHYLCLAQVVTTQVTAQGWGLWMTQLCAPDASYQQQLPAMIAIVNSWKTDDAVMQQETNQWVANSNANFNASQDANRTVQQGYDDYNHGQQVNSIQRSRSVDDFDETIRGVRDVRDTQTGQMGQVDLGNSDQIVDQLNQGQPGRFVQVPLRDTADPMPGQQ